MIRATLFERSFKPATPSAWQLKQPSEWLDHEVASAYRYFLQQKLHFCDRLEILADLLPDGADSHDCLMLAQNVVPLILRAHGFEEQVIFPRLAAKPELSVEVCQSLERLRFEHMGDEEFAHDLCIALREFAVQRSSARSETLAWMLRGFFEGLRRHIAFEQALILPEVERNLGKHENKQQSQ